MVLIGKDSNPTLHCIQRKPQHAFLSQHWHNASNTVGVVHLSSLLSGRPFKAHPVCQARVVAEPLICLYGNFVINQTGCRRDEVHIQPE